MKRHSRRHFLRGAGRRSGGCNGRPLLNRAPVAVAAGGGIACPNPIPTVNENRCTDPATWSSDFQIANYGGAGGTGDRIYAWATKTSWDLSEIASSPVTLRAGYYDFGQPDKPTQLSIFRLGYYGNRGARLVYSKAITLTHPGDADAPAADTGLRKGPTGTGTFALTDFHPPASGVYLAKFKVTSGPAAGYDAQVVFIIRDDARKRDLLVGMPTNTWLAYNNWGGKSVYYVQSNTTAVGQVGAEPGTSRYRAVKASFDRPWSNQLSTYDWVLHTEFPLIFWLEHMGYDVAYTEDVAVHRNPSQLLPAHTGAYVISGHSEYWTQGMRDGVEAARDAGTHIASFSSNTNYWRVRYEDSERTMCCWKTVEGTTSAGTGAAGNNDPVSPTTTFRDRGASSGGPPSSGGVRNGISKPENAVFGALYIGDDDGNNFPMTIPAGAGGGGEFGAHRAWRNTSVASGGGATIGSKIVGWEWDAIPSGSSPSDIHALARSLQPAGVKRLAETQPTRSGSTPTYLQDDGRVRATTPPAGLSGLCQAVIHTAPSGAIVFAGGSMQFSYGLGPHYSDGLPGGVYTAPRQDESDPRIQQLAYNIFSDMGVKPATPTEGVVLDPEPGPTGSTGPTGTTGTTGTSGTTGTTQPPAPPPTTTGASGPPGVAPDTQPPRLYVSRSGVRLTADGALRMRVFLADDEPQGASGTVTLRTTGLVKTSRRAKARRLTLGTRSFQVLSGKTAIVEFRPSKAVRKLISDRGRLALTAETVATDRARNHTRLRTAFLALPYKKATSSKKS